MLFVTNKPIMLSVVYAECHKKAQYAECHKKAQYAECRYAECRGTLLHLLSAFGLDQFNLSNFSWSDGKELELINLSTKFSRKFYIFCKLYRFRVQKKTFYRSKTA
jgi:hypothetical protein